MSWSTRAPLMIVAASVIPAGIVVEVSHDVGSWPGWVAVAGAGIALALSAALWLRRRDDAAEIFVGLGASVLVLAMAGLGAWRGAVEAQVDDAAKAALARTDLDQFGGWIGQTASDGVQYMAMEHGADSAIVQKIHAMFERRFDALLVTVDNRGGTKQVVLDVTDAKLEPASAGKDLVLPRAAVLDSALGGRDIARQMHGGRYVAQPGERTVALVFLDPARTLERITGLTVVANGQPLTIPGRFYSVAEKQALSGHKRQ